jgi:hypothetical protein
MTSDLWGLRFIIGDMKIFKLFDPIHIQTDAHKVQLNEWAAWVELNLGVVSALVLKCRQASEKPLGVDCWAPNNPQSVQHAMLKLPL